MPGHSHDLSRLADEELLQRVADGDHEAFGVIYDRHARVAYSLAYRLLGARQPAEDLVQEAFMVVWRRPEGYLASRGSVRTWLLAIVHHRGVDMLRRNTARAGREERVAVREPRVVEGIDDQVIAEDEAAHVRAALEGLPAEQSECLRLAYFGGFTSVEIADALGIPQGTVKSRIRLGLERLRAAMRPREAPVR